MAEVTATLAPALPEQLRPLLSFDVGPGAVEEIAAKLVDVARHSTPAERDRAQVGAGRAGGEPLQLGERGRGGHRGGPGTARRASASGPRSG